MSLEDLKKGDCIKDHIREYQVDRFNDNGSVKITSGEREKGTEVGMSYTPEELKEAGFKKSAQL